VSLIRRSTRHDEPLLFGVEEEFLLADTRSRCTVARAAEVIEAAAKIMPNRVAPEFCATQLETRSEPTSVAQALRADLAEIRRVVSEAGARSGCLLVACPTAVLADQPLLITDDDRYHRIADHIANVLDTCDSEICGCHIHLGSLARDEALALSAHLRPWLPVIHALAANSPFAGGRDHGCASWRSVLYGRWPTVGPAPVVDKDGYEQLTAHMIASGAIADRKMIYWYARPSEHLPTLEIRVADVNADLDVTVLLAVLLRALATDLLADVRDEAAYPLISDEQLREGHDQAILYGLRGTAFDPAAGVRRPMTELLTAMLERSRGALEAAGDISIATRMLARIGACGTGADRQRAVYRRRRSWVDVVDYLAMLTAAPSE
jgi:carboxylate-amine ligase